MGKRFERGAAQAVVDKACNLFARGREAGRDLGAGGRFIPLEQSGGFDVVNSKIGNNPDVDSSLGGQVQFDRIARALRYG